MKAIIFVAGVIFSASLAHGQSYAGSWLGPDPQNNADANMARSGKVMRPNQTVIRKPHYCRPQDNADANRPDPTVCGRK